jgi:hypothetical protein
VRISHTSHAGIEQGLLHLLRPRTGDNHYWFAELAKETGLPQDQGLPIDLDQLLGLSQAT